MMISVCPVPAALTQEHLKGVVVVIDALRMTSVAMTAIQNGCPAVCPVSGLEEARALAHACGAKLGGERGAMKIEGFDFSNSPLEYTRDAISACPLIMTTTNGTNALLAAKPAPRVLLGAFLNASAVARTLSAEQSVCFLCSGTNGRFSLEDALAAGAMIDRLTPFEPEAELDDMAQASLLLYWGAKTDLNKALQGVAHYRRLEALGFKEDLRYCLSVDTLSVVPELCADGWIREKKHEKV